MGQSFSRNSCLQRNAEPIKEITEKKPEQTAPVTNNYISAYKDGNNSRSPRIRALYDFDARDTEELSFKANDRMELLDQSRGNWWFARQIISQMEGYVPRNYVVIDDGRPTSLDAWYDIGRREASRLLLIMGNPSGTYIIRPSSAANSFALSIRYNDLKTDTWLVKHYKIKMNDAGDYFISQEVKRPCIDDLIRYYEENGRLCTKLFKACPRTERPSVQFRDIEVNRKSINKVKMIGAGSFGEVWLATWSNAITVAVKTLKPHTMDPKMFIQEAEVMHKLQHPRIVTLLGVCTKDEPIYIITEYLENGSLLNFLQTESGRAMKFNDLIDIMAQITEGMMYLETSQFVHRDLRAANILVGENREVKVADFGLARLTEDSVYSGFENTKYPIKWTAPEAQMFRRFSIKSDVWSFGILMYEIVTFGGTPYPGMDNRTVMREVQNGYRIGNPTSQNPRHCSDPLYEIMTQCWMANPDERPTFSHLNSVFDDWQASTEIQYQDECM